MSAIVSSPVDVWTAATSGAWSVAANWSLGRPPHSGENVVIDTTAPLTVTFDVANLSLGSLTLTGASLDLEGGWLSASGAATLRNAKVTGVKPLVLAGASAIQGLTVGGGAILYNKGVVTQSGGTLAIGDSAASTAAVSNVAGATWIVSDTSGMTQGSATGWRFHNNGLFQKTSAGGIALIQANFISTGTIASATGGDIEFDGKWTSLSGTFIGAGMVDYGPDGVAFVGNVNVTAATCQTNWGIVNLVGTMTMYDGSTIMNAAGARWNFAGDSSIALAAGQAAGPDINGMGVIAKIKGTGTSHVGINVATEGVVSVQTGTLSFEGASSAFSSTINGAGTFQIAAGAAQIEQGAHLTVGHWTLAGGTTTLQENVGYFYAFTGQAGASLDLGGYSLTLVQSADFAGLAIDGAGVLQAPGGATISGLTVGGAARLNFTGAVTQSGGNVVIGDSPTSSAQIRNLAGGTWTITDDSGMTQGGISGWGFINRGLFQKASETSGAGLSLISANFFSTGTIAPASGVTIEFDGKLTNLAGTYAGSSFGQIEYGPDGVATINNVQVTGPILQDNEGVVNLVGTMTVYGGSSFSNGEAIFNAGHWNFAGDSSLLLAAGQPAGPYIQNGGLIAKTAGTGTSYISISVASSGPGIEVDTGTLAFEGAANVLRSTIFGAGTFEIAGGATTLEGFGSSQVQTANWTLAGGNTGLGLTLTYLGNFAGKAGATLAPGGHSLTLSGTTSLSGLAIVGSGDLILASTANVSGVTIGGTARIIDEGVVTQSGGNITVGDGTPGATANLLLFGGVWDIADASGINMGASALSTITIGFGFSSGLLEKTGAGTSVIAAQVINNGDIVSSSLPYRGVEVSAGTLDFKQYVTGTGTETIVGAATLEFDNYVGPGPGGAGQTVSFSGAGGNLFLTDIRDFHAAIVGFDTVGSSDAILLSGFLALTGASETNASTTLSFSGGSTLTLTGDYRGDVFSQQFMPGGILKITI